MTSTSHRKRNRVGITQTATTTVNFGNVLKKQFRVFITILLSIIYNYYSLIMDYSFH